MVDQVTGFTQDHNRCQYSTIFRKRTGYDII
jgi:hypothetical protein